ncbi:MAG: glyoxalase/bleomycin resistance/dioxygenase family protein [Cytophagales bacterium]|nr:glyoxalase/bleomycin resistance/dioxygenase family protein [Cytophagales bacterium]
MLNSQVFPKMHVSLYVQDIQATVEFYDAFFGQKADKVKDNYAKYILNSPALVISFVENPTRTQSNFGHLGIQVDSEEKVHHYLNVAKSKGLETKEEMGTNCCYARQDKFWVNDPDGHQWEIYYFHEDVEFNDPHYAEESQSACCMPSSQEEAEPVVQEVEVKKFFKVKEYKATTCEPNSGCC